MKIALAQCGHDGPISIDAYYNSSENSFQAGFLNALSSAGISLHDLFEGPSCNNKILVDIHSWAATSGHPANIILLSNEPYLLADIRKLTYHGFNLFFASIQNTHLYLASVRDMMSTISDAISTLKNEPRLVTQTRIEERIHAKQPLFDVKSALKLATLNGMVGMIGGAVLCLDYSN